ncbi:hypothetical protein QCM77_17815 [Bradyrhizobium sp. SSUT18]|uniref:hypothetical protein n=1 Tax=Bradyrhizobium sp. SSUT18 TaxID=3040602 RepID=UPI002449065B|nr:hypothetical protein [Bradyrhizobium sp. SSUT18]MDH2401803.1 hypothetical protein [Bradyrhizobium sp. SSUT18]
MFDEVFTYQSTLAGPIITAIGKGTGIQTAAVAPGVLWVPGWTFLGATYEAVVVQPFSMISVGSLLIMQRSGKGPVCRLFRRTLGSEPCILRTLTNGGAHEAFAK